MILGVAQVVVNLRDIGAAAAALRRAGYRCSFSERHLPSHPAKAQFLAVKRSRLDLSHFTPPAESTAVELTAYAGAPPAGRPAYRLVLNDGPGADWLPADRLVPGDVHGAVSHVTVLSGDPPASRTFWNGLGFQADKRGRLAFPTPVPAWRLELELEPVVVPAAATLDAQGCVLVTLLTTRIEDDLASLRGRARTSAPWNEPVGGRAVRAAVVEGPGGELVELIQVEPGTTRRRSGAAP